MTLKDYQEKAMETCTESSNNITYMLSNLVGEVGELASKFAKAVRKEKVVVNNNRLEILEQDEKLMQEMKLEAGDILWQLSGLCTVMGWNLDDVAECNIEKLASRKQRNVIVGDGDNR